MYPKQYHQLADRVTPDQWSLISKSTHLWRKSPLVDELIISIPSTSMSRYSIRIKRHENTYVYIENNDGWLNSLGDQGCRGLHDVGRFGGSEPLLWYPGGTNCKKTPMRNRILSMALKKGRRGKYLVSGRDATESSVTCHHLIMNIFSSNKNIETVRHPAITSAVSCIFSKLIYQIKDGLQRTHFGTLRSFQASISNSLHVSPGADAKYVSVSFSGGGSATFQ